MGEVFFSSDHHFGHDRIINFCKRPYTNVVDMDIDLIRLWNQTVAPGDTVWYLGDFSFYRNKEIIEAILDQLAGEKHLLLGNHDNQAVQEARGWASIQHYKEISADNKKIVLFHYPMVDWNGRFHAAWHLYGHTHNRFHPVVGERAMDVGVDGNNYRPINLTQVKAKIENGWQGASGWFR